MTIELPAGAKIDSVDNTKCRTLLSQVQCDITSVNKGGDFKATLKMKLPSQANYDETNNEIKTKLNYTEEDAVNADGEETDVITTEPLKVEINPSTGGLIVPWLLLPQGVGN